MTRTGILELGKMGISHCAILGAHPDVKLVSVCDSSVLIVDGFARTDLGGNLITDAFKNKYILIENLEIQRISKIQPHQYQKRLLVGYMILVIQIPARIFLFFENTDYMKPIRYFPILKSFKKYAGTLRRFIQFKNK